MRNCNYLVRARVSLSLYKNVSAKGEQTLLRMRRRLGFSATSMVYTGSIILLSCRRCHPISKHEKSLFISVELNELRKILSNVKRRLVAGTVMAGHFELDELRYLVIGIKQIYKK